MSLSKLAELVIVRNQLALLEGNTALVIKDIRREVSNIKLKMDKLFLEEVVKLNLDEEMMPFLESIKRDFIAPTDGEAKEIKNALKKLPLKSKDVISNKTVSKEEIKKAEDELLEKAIDNAIPAKLEGLLTDVVDDEIEEISSEELDRKAIAESISKAKAAIKDKTKKPAGFKRVEG
jgi:hypothetical protein